MFFGPKIAKSYIISHLIRDLPNRIGVYESYLGLDAGYFAMPQKWYTFDPERRDYSPYVFVDIGNSDRTERISYTPGGTPYFVTTYPTMLVLWVSDKSRREVTDYRDVYSALIRDSLIRTPTLRPADSSNLECHIRINESTIGETYSATIKEGTNNYWAALMVEFESIVEETLDYPIQGIFRESKITVDHMDITPTPPRSVIPICTGTSCSLVWDEPAWNGGFYEIDEYEVEYSEVLNHKSDILVTFRNDAYEDVQGSDFQFEEETYSWTSAGDSLSASDYTTLKSTSSVSLGDDVEEGHTAHIKTYGNYYNVSGLVTNKTYRFRVRAVNSAGASSWAYSHAVTLN